MPLELKGFVNDGEGGRRCPTEKCGAICCTVGNPFAENLFQKLDPAISCQFLEKDFGCQLQRTGGRMYKPLWCSIWPRNQGDIDEFNRLFSTKTQKCLLYFEEVDREEKFD